MGVIVHDGTSIPDFAQRIRPSDTDVVWFSWALVLDSGEGFSASDWVVPDGWTESADYTDSSVTDEDGNTYASCNGVVVVVPSSASGAYTLRNTVTTDGTPARTLTRSVRIVVDDL